MVAAVRVLGVSLTTVHEIWMWFLLPAIVRCLAYILDLSLTIGMIFKHFQDKEIRWGVLTIVIIYMPSVVFFIMTVSKSKISSKNGTKRKIVWFMSCIGQLLMFPVWAIYRYGKKLFWSVEALHRQGSAREQALDRASGPSRIELYLFLHAFLHAAPQASLQLYIILNQLGQNLAIDASQVLCVLSSLVLLSLTVVSFQRFESQRLAGKMEPWVVKPSPNLETTHTPSSVQGEQTQQPPDIEVIPPTPQSSLSDGQEREEEEIQYIPNLPPLEVKQCEDDDNSSQCEVHTFRTASSQPTVRKSIKALENDDPLGMTVAFFWWLFFLLSRVLTLITFAQFYPTATVIVCVVHCLIATACLLAVNGFSSVQNVAQQLCLGVIYLYCLIEYKTKFRKVKIVYALYFCIMFLENTSISIVWMLTNKSWKVKWCRYVFVIVFVTYIISMSAMGLYLKFFKPKVTSFYIDKVDKVSFPNDSSEC